MKTTVINLIGGPGCGKSTTAAALFAWMKMAGRDVELVREYVKSWAWDGIKIGPYDQLYLLGKQARQESRLYGKVEYVVTDSPFLLSAVYENFYRGVDVCLPTVLRFIRYAQSNGVEYKNFLIERSFSYDARGRYEDESTARRVDLAIKEFLDTYDLPYRVISADHFEIARRLGLLGEEPSLEIPPLAQVQSTVEIITQ